MSSYLEVTLNFPSPKIRDDLLTKILSNLYLSTYVYYCVGVLLFVWLSCRAGNN